MEYRPLAPARFAVAPERESSEAKFWRRFRTARVEHLSSVASHICFSPVAPHDFAVTHGTRVALYQARSSRSKHALSRFQASAYCGVFRGDGALLAAGDSAHRVKVFDVARRRLLRDLRGHTAPVRVVAWLNSTELASGGDDGTLRRWSTASQDEVDARAAHGDHVRVLQPAGPNLVLSGAYDHAVRLWDWRVPKAVRSCDCGAPVEAMALAQGGGLLYAAAGPQVQVWDMLGGGRKVHEFSNHAKTVTSLCLDAEGERLLTAALDGHIKVVSTADFSVAHAMRFPAGVVGLGLSPDSLRLVAALADGSLMIRQRTPLGGSGQLQEKRRVDRLKGGTYAFFTRGKNALPTEADAVVAVGEKQRLKPYDKALQRFKYMEGLDLALATKNAVTILSVLRELKMRRGLKTAIGGRTDEALEPLLSYLVTNVSKPRYAPLLLEVVHLVLDTYADEVGSSMLIDELFKRLQSVVHEEIRSQEKGLELMGALEAIAMASRRSAEA